MATYGSRSSDTASWDHRAGTGWQDSVLLLARLLIGAIFVQSGFGKLTGLAAFTASMEGMGVPMASVTAPVGACVEFFGGLAIVLGAWTWLAAILVAGFTVVASFIAHRFWDAPADQRMMQNIQFMKNVAIVGGLLALVAAGPGRFSLDGFMRRQR
ncbi:DoxX family protein [Azospirillum sp. sgz301742]